MSSDDLSNQMEGILELMTQRASGRVDNHQVETAVQKVLASLGTAPDAKNQSVVRDSKPSFKVDMGNYDEDDEDDHCDEEPESVSNSAASSCEVPKPISSQLRYTPVEYRLLLDDIPMGKVGSQMMTTFGDGPQPDIEALELALKGVREALQLMVMDARAVWRKAKVHFVHAQEQALSGFRKAKMLETQQAVDPSLVYRAILNEEAKAHDPLGKNKPCGFDVDQLQTLYPEEVRAYHRWSELHSEYSELANKKPDQGDDDENSKAEGESSERQQPDGGDDDEEKEGAEEYLGGHLKERAATFDARTLDMEKESYIEFSRIRQGSFLPRRQQRSPLEMEWEAIDNKRGRMKEGSWMRMSAVSVRFLHWLGFDPPEKPPPDAETTQVLGFLGYDRMGRIVEKAVYLRNARRNKDGENPTDLRLRKLPEGDHLTKDDIQEALLDPDVKPQSLFRLEKQSQSFPNTQLYFGPGFEQRLELELEEMLAGSTASPGDDDETRKREKEFFVQLSATPKHVDGLRYLISKHNGEILDDGGTGETGDHVNRAGMRGSDVDAMDQRDTSDDDDEWRERKRPRKD